MSQITQTKISVDWNYIDNACKELANRIKNDNITFDYIYGIPRGGLVIAVIMSHLLDIDILQECYIITNEHILFVDDISDTGTTLEKYSNTEIANDAKFLTIHKSTNSKFIPDYYFEETDSWIIYPWETKETSKADYKEAVKKGEN